MEFRNPDKIELKQFLAGFDWISQHSYSPPYKICSHFTKDIFDKATKLDIRCACAIVNFENNPICHSVVAFETDHGLIYIEPQSGTEASIVEKKPYPNQLKEIPDGSTVRIVQLMWNDSMPPCWIFCADCDYILPTYEIFMPKCLECAGTNLRFEFPRDA